MRIPRVPRCHTDTQIKHSHLRSWNGNSLPLVFAFCLGWREKMTIKAPMMPSRLPHGPIWKCCWIVRTLPLPHEDRFTKTFDGSGEGRKGLRKKTILYWSELPFIFRRGGQSMERQEWESFEFFTRMLRAPLPFPVSRSEVRAR